KVVTFYGSSLLDASVPAGQELTIKGASRPGLVTKNGLVVLVRNLQFEDGKMIPASKYFSADETTALELTEEEKKIAEDIR
ncbi:AL1L2 dehydrogenase, partial [Prunella fulvescens]|nr:AL1L2 dehydrogenase [Prunella fulvescens]